ncbi:3-hydroxyacyl-CoA dehydrogenase NAD-binding domain-containing protein [Aurantivibrio plasticivorans]
MSKVASLSIENGIAIIEVNNPPVNTITAQVRDDLNSVLDDLEKAGNYQAVVFLCAGKTYFSGADINEFSGPPKEEEYRKLFARLENQDVPVITAMYGTVMGGGLEIALACHYRLAESKARFGFPEVTLGIFPGAGGTQRMPRIIGVEKTLEMVVSARPVDATTAKEMGFVDGIVEGDIKQAAIDYANQLIAEGAKVRPTSKMTVDPATGTDEIIEKFVAQAKKLYPGRQAALSAIDVVKASMTKSFEDGLLYEDKLVNIAKETPESKGAIHLFFAERQTAKVPGLADNVEKMDIKKAAIIGAGTMGGGIAMCFANAGIPATLIDVSQEGLDRGIERIKGDYGSRVKRGRMTQEKADATIALIDGATDMSAVSDADVVIEAVFEDMSLKQSIFKELDAKAKPGAILATNTSTLDINEIASVTGRPDKVIGLHFFSPANVMPLLEVVRTDSTSDSTIASAMNLAKTLRKTPVLAKVCYGFIGNRMMEGYAREAEFMALEGATPKKVDDALQKFGMAMGILAVFDMAGVDVGVNVHKANAEQFPPDPAYYQASQAIYDAGRMGQKNGKGFYLYKPGDRQRYEDPEALEILRKRAEELGIEQRNDHTEEEIIERCVYALINDGIKILEEGIALRASDIDVVWGAGYGFARFRGGPLYYADTIGLKTVYDGIMKYQAKFGDMHWQPASLLEKLAKEGKTLAQWEAEQA